MEFSGKHSFTLHPSLDLTDRITDGETHTLALRGLEEPAHASRGMEEIQKSLSLSD